ncbi:MAG: adenylate/guanylate cyclase domain-containing protein [Bacteroidetes bacterium]|nr:MAG: adenylate/guanylate cyclase domain-containing protein [Bacteroidota bacterium]
MKRLSHSYLPHILFSVVAWICAITLFSFIRIYGVDEEGLYYIVSAEISTWQIALFQGLFMGAAFGLIFGWLDLVIDKRVRKQATFGVVILVRSLIHLLATLVIIHLSIYFSLQEVEKLTHTQISDIIREHVITRTTILLLIYTAVFSFLFNLIQQINNMFGPGILLNIISGKYHRPTEERRVFVFLDLQSSTTYAEQLGHKLYSELIQDCFYDLTDTVRKYQAAVYQYVGDEAVLTWREEDGLADWACIRACFHFEDTIRKRASYYFNKYDLVPAFKAGINCGPVMVTEVGVVKKEIAYHSDVLNTAARIQGRCNELGQRVLISSYLQERLSPLPEYRVEEVGEVYLKGKRQQVKLFAVNRNSDEI